MKIGWFSAGITSAVACKMAIEIHGVDNVNLVYIDLKRAHHDNDRFIKDCENWYGKKIERIYPGKFADHISVIRQTRYINGPKGARCTTELKVKTRQSYQNSIDWDGQIFGFEFDRKEVNRAIRFCEQYPVSPEFPLIERKWTKENCASALEMAGIELPEMYKLGYRNNNCIGCVKGGKAYWNKIRIDFPNVFEEMAKAEREIGHSCINGLYLDELNPNQGYGSKPITPNCGTFCSIEFENIDHPMLSAVMQGQVKFSQLKLF